MKPSSETVELHARVRPQRCAGAGALGFVPGGVNALMRYSYHHEDLRAYGLGGCHTYLTKATWRPTETVQDRRRCRQGHRPLRGTVNVLHGGDVLPMAPDSLHDSAPNSLHDSAWSRFRV
jgi:hypothetical protein